MQDNFPQSMTSQKSLRPVNFLVLVASNIPFTQFSDCLMNELTINRKGQREYNWWYEDTHVDLKIQTCQSNNTYKLRCDKAVLNFNIGSFKTTYLVLVSVNSRNVTNVYHSNENTILSWRLHDCMFH